MSDIKLLKSLENKCFDFQISNSQIFQILKSFKFSNLSNYIGLTKSLYKISLTIWNHVNFLSLYSFRSEEIRKSSDTRYLEIWSKKYNRLVCYIKYQLFISGWIIPENIFIDMASCKALKNIKKNQHSFHLKYFRTKALK